MIFILLALSPVAFLALVRLEERDRREVAVLVVIGVLVVEALIYPSQNSVPGGLFHPSLAGQAMRLPEIIIPMALLARVVVHGPPGRLGPAATAWTAFITWHALGLPLGVMMGNPIGEVLFQSKAIIYLGGGFALVAGVPITRLAHSSITRRLLVGLGLTLAIILPFAYSNRSLTLSFPLAPGASLGQLSADASTIFASIATAALLLEAARRKRALVAGMAAVPLLLSPLVATQRAAVLGVVTTGILLALASLGPSWSRRIRSRPTEALVLLCIVLVPVLTTVTVRAALSTSDRTEIVPLADTVGETFLTTRKAQSAETRQNLWREGFEQTQEYPITGWGLGKVYRVERASSDDPLVGGGFHNILIDLLVRRGAVGALLFLAAIALTLKDALAVWQHHLDRRIAVFCGACGAILMGLLTKGMVESVFEKFRLATLMGLLLGAIASGASSLRTSRLASAPGELRLTP